jgi:hypothetical protein
MEKKVVKTKKVKKSRGKKSDKLPTFSLIYSDRALKKIEILYAAFNIVSSMEGQISQKAMRIALAEISMAAGRIKPSKKLHSGYL